MEQEVESLETECEPLRTNFELYCRIQDGNMKAIPYAGTPGATSQYASNHGAASAFKPQGEGDKPYATDGTEGPHTVWYKFEEPHIVAKISLRSRNDWTTVEQAPEDLTFKGSDDCETWVTLKEVAHAGFTEGGEKREFSIPCSARSAYRCYGITVSESTSTSYSHVSLADVVMYE